MSDPDRKEAFNVLDQATDLLASLTSDEYRHRSQFTDKQTRTINRALADLATVTEEEPPDTRERVPWAEAVGRVAARGNWGEGWTIEHVTETHAQCRNGHSIRHGERILCVPDESTPDLP